MEIIYSYSRANAIEDGVLVDVTEYSRRAGFYFPVALSRAVWISLVEVTPLDLGDETLNRTEKFSCECKEMEKLAALILALKNAILTVTKDYRVYFTHAGRNLYAVCGPGDDARPVITVMCVGED